MTADGYGTCYAQLEGRMNVVISAWRSCQETSAGKFRDTLARTLCDLRAVCLSASGGANAKL